MAAVLHVELVQTAIFVSVLGVIGWGFGLAAALVQRSVRALGRGAGAHIWISGVVLAVLIAFGALHAYLIVLNSVGYVQFSKVPVYNELCGTALAPAPVC